jgi:hypothetical protein
VLEAAYRLQVKRARAQRAINKVFRDIDDENIEVPADLRKRLAKRIKGKSDSWDEALSEIAREEERERRQRDKAALNESCDFCI